MTFARSCSLLLLSVAIVGAQDGLIAAASRLVTLPPTDAYIQITVSTGTQKTLDDVLEKVKSVGLTLEHLTTVSSTAAITALYPGMPETPGSNSYAFRLTVPIRETTATLRRMQQLASDSEYRVASGLAGVGPSLAAIHEAQQQAFPDLYKQAKARAEQMAGSAGLSAGKVLSVSDTYQYVTVTSLYTAVQVPLTVAVRIAID